jgi:hypothetical protein
MDGQWKEVPTRTLCFFCDYGTQNRRVLDCYKNGTARLTGNTPGFQTDGLSAVLECFGYWIHVISPNSLYDTGAFP